MLPSVLLETENPERSSPDGAPWQTRVVPNKYPALTPNADAPPEAAPFHQTAPAQGRQEVLIETPQHDRPLANLSVDAVGTVVDTYLQRYHALRQEDERLVPLIFRNHGRTAGASLHHPHSQIIAPALPPPDVAFEEEQALRHYQATGTCLLCALRDREVQEKTRLVLENDHVTCFVPYAAEVSCAVWIVPRRHCADFGDLAGDERPAFAAALREVLGRLRHRFGDPAYNFYIRSSLAYGSVAPHLHWHLRLLPRLAQPAGFELGAGMSINPSLPEEDAALLREA